MGSVIDNHFFYVNTRVPSHKGKLIFPSDALAPPSSLPDQCLHFSEPTCLSHSSMSS